MEGEIHVYAVREKSPPSHKKELVAIRKIQSIGRIMKKHRLDYEDYEILYERQKGLCGICKGDKKKLVVDHNHRSGLVRGLLCFGCNSGLGLFADNPEHLERAILYLGQEYRRES